jgi:hypothetical protein
LEGSCQCDLVPPESHNARNEERPGHGLKLNPARRFR